MDTSTSKTTSEPATCAVWSESDGVIDHQTLSVAHPRNVIQRIVAPEGRSILRPRTRCQVMATIAIPPTIELRVSNGDGSGTGKRTTPATGTRRAYAGTSVANGSLDPHHMMATAATRSRNPSRIVTQANYPATA